MTLPRLIVDAPCGSVSGLWDEETGLGRFLGIPYAEPPVGQLRFKPTVPKKRWKRCWRRPSAW